MKQLNKQKKNGNNIKNKNYEKKTLFSINKNTRRPYLHTLDLKESDKLKLRHFIEPKPAREISLIYPKNELKIQIIDALRNTIAGVIKGAIVFQNVEIISPTQKK